MVSSRAATVDEYLEELPPERRDVVAAIRAAVLAHLPAGYEEGMQYGMIGYYIPLDDYPDTHNGQPLGYAAIAAQKHNYAVYLTGVYLDREEEARFRAAWQGKLDMGKSCVRFKRLEQADLEALGASVARVPPARLIELHEAARSS